MVMTSAAQEHLLSAVLEQPMTRRINLKGTDYSAATSEISRVSSKVLLHQSLVAESWQIYS